MPERTDENIRRLLRETFKACTDRRPFGNRRYAAPVN
jgi:hypothetical protein